MEQRLMSGRKTLIRTRGQTLGQGVKVGWMLRYPEVLGASMVVFLMAELGRDPQYLKVLMGAFLEAQAEAGRRPQHPKALMETFLEAPPELGRDPQHLKVLMGTFVVAPPELGGVLELAA